MTNYDRTRILALYQGILQTCIFNKISDADLQGAIRLVVKDRQLMDAAELTYCEKYYQVESWK